MNRANHDLSSGEFSFLMTLPVLQTQGAFPSVASSECAPNTEVGSSVQLASRGRVAVIDRFWKKPDTSIRESAVAPAGMFARNRNCHWVGIGRRTRSATWSVRRHVGRKNRMPLETLPPPHTIVQNVEARKVYISIARIARCHALFRSKIGDHVFGKPASRGFPAIKRPGDPGIDISWKSV